MKSNKSFMAKRIKHNDLLPWFTMDHGQLPASYLKHTQKFFDELRPKGGRVGPKVTSSQAKKS
jgi:hypothetical protein